MHGKLRFALGVVAIMAVVGVGYVLRSHQGVRSDYASIPRSTQGLLRVASLPALGAAIDRTLARLDLGMVVGSPRASLTHQIGFDPFSAKALQQRGFDSKRPWLLAAEGSDNAVVVIIPVANAVHFEETVGTLLKNIRLAKTLVSRTNGTHKIKLALNARGETTAAWFTAPKRAYFSAGRDSEARLLPFLEQRKDSLDHDPGFVAAQSAVGGQALVFAWGRGEGAPSLSKALGPLASQLEQVAVGLTVQGQQLSLRAHLQVAAATAAALGILEDGAVGGDPIARSAADTVLLVRAGLNLGAALSRLKQSPALQKKVPALEHLESELLARGLSLKALAALFKPGLVVGLRPAAQLNLAHLPSLDLRRSNPFDSLRLEARLPITDPKKARALLPQVAAALSPSLHAAIDKQQLGDVELFTVRYQLGEGLSFGVVGQTLLFTGGTGAFKEAMARQTQRPPSGGLAAKLALDPLLPRLQREGALGAWLDLDGIVRALKAMETGGLGGGPQGMAISILLRKASGVLSAIRDLSFFFQRNGSALGLELDLRFSGSDVGRKKQGRGTP